MTARPPYDPEQVAIREAATVVLARDAGGRIEVFLQHRVSSMEFAPGMAVFPGGGVEERDRTGAGWLGAPPDRWGEDFGVASERAAAAVRAAIRELCEETGVLLASPREAGPTPTPMPVSGAERRELESGGRGIEEFAAARGLVPDARLLRPLDRWTTPVGPPRRYDTLFFLADLPAGLEPDGDTSEADRTGWTAAADAVRDGEAGRLGLLPPTMAVLRRLAGFPDVASALAATPSIPPGGN